MGNQGMMFGGSGGGGGGGGNQSGGGGGGGGSSTTTQVSIPKDVSTNSALAFNSLVRTHFSQV